MKYDIFIIMHEFVHVQYMTETIKFGNMQLFTKWKSCTQVKPAVCNLEEHSTLWKNIQNMLLCHFVLFQLLGCIDL